MQLSPPTFADRPSSAVDAERALAAALDRIALLTGSNGGSRGDSAESSDQEAFMPIEPDSFGAAGLTDSEVEALILKFLLRAATRRGATSPTKSSFPSCPSVSC